MAIHRVIVRGFFDDLNADVAAGLRAQQSEHDVLRSKFTHDGTLVYGPDLGAFSFRFEVRTDGPGDDPTELDAALRIAAERAIASLTALGAGYKHLRTVGSDMADVWK